MLHYPEPIARLIESFMKLPGVGEKTATRYAFHVLGMDESEVTQFARHLISVKRELHFCPICGNITDQEKCDICRDTSRDNSTILVVEHSRDIMSMEKMNEYHGLYHVLHGVLSPMEGVGADDLNLASLMRRLYDEAVKEVIIATNATADGEATARYIHHLLKGTDIKVTRLAYGLSVGSDIEYADEMTLLKAVEGRQEM